MCPSRAIAAYFACVGLHFSPNQAPIPAKIARPFRKGSSLVDCSRSKFLSVVGAKHTSDAAEPQLGKIERRWDEFKPSIALCEGCARMFRFATRPESGKLSESELTRILANRNDVPLYTLEPTYEAEVAGLLNHFEPRLVATYMTLRVYSAEADHSGTAQDRLALDLLRKRTRVDGLSKTFRPLPNWMPIGSSSFPINRIGDP